MNIKLDKDDLFRSAIPGYVFFVVIFSFYVLVGKLMAIAGAQALLTIVAGFPLGFIFYHIHRFLHVAFPISFVSWWQPVWGPEQRGMEAVEAELIWNRLPKNLIQRLSLDGDERVKNRELSQLFELYLNKVGNETFKARNHFLIMRVHSLSGSIIAILSALSSVFLFKRQDWELLPLRKVLGRTHSISCEVNCLMVLWLVIALFFWIVRQGANQAYQLSMKRMIIGFWKDFEEFAQKYLNNNLHQSEGEENEN